MTTFPELLQSVVGDALKAGVDPHEIVHALDMTSHQLKNMIFAQPEPKVQEPLIVVPR